MRQNQARKTTDHGSILPALQGQTRVDVLMPAFNEADTITEAIDAVLGVRVDNLDICLTVIESGSTDGTRALVQRYATHPRVTVLLEDQPRGKGAAVRAGIWHTDGDVILIQDADLEYDVQDYMALLDPLTSGAADFVLGTRHSSAKPMRQFDDQPLRAALMNAGHWGFTRWFNALFGVRLSDPFTMYKVFRRECLDGVVLRCNRFDFDWELVARLIQRGFQPIEIPVSYQSRSYSAGKKVRFFRDPLTWLATSTRCRLTPPSRHPRAQAPGSHP